MAGGLLVTAKTQDLLLEAALPRLGQVEVVLCPELHLLPRSVGDWLKDWWHVCVGRLCRWWFGRSLARRSASDAGGLTALDRRDEVADCFVGQAWAVGGRSDV